MKPLTNYILFALGLFCSVLVAGITSLAVPQFADVYRSFGADLPVLTRITLEYYPVLWGIPALVVLTWLFWPARDLRGVIAGATGIGSLTLLTPFLIVVLYFPIQRLGQVV